MRVSLVINTNCAAPHARDPGFGGGPPRAARWWLLRNLLLPWYTSMDRFDDIVVVGNFEPGPGYRYLGVPPVHQNVADLWRQRQMGFEMTRGEPDDWVLYMADDHLWDPANRLPEPTERADILIPSRWTRARTPAGEPLNDGDGGTYIHFHGTLIKRRVTEGIPWIACGGFPLDLAYTHAVLNAGFRIHYAPEVRIWDVEQGATPWQ